MLLKYKHLNGGYNKNISMTDLCKHILNTFTFTFMHLADAFIQATYIAFKLQFYILSALNNALILSK